MFSNEAAAQVPSTMYTGDSMVTLPSDSFSIHTRGSSPLLDYASSADGSMYSSIQEPMYDPVGSIKSVRALMSPCSPMAYQLAKKIRPAISAHFHPTGLLHPSSPFAQLFNPIHNNTHNSTFSPRVSLDLKGGGLLHPSNYNVHNHLDNSQFPSSPNAFGLHTTSSNMNQHTHSQIMNMLDQGDRLSMSAPPSLYMSGTVGTLHSPFSKLQEHMSDRTKPGIFQYNQTALEDVENIQDTMTSMKLESVDDYTRYNTMHHLKEESIHNANQQNMMNTLKQSQYLPPVLHHNTHQPTTHIVQQCQANHPNASMAYVPQYTNIDPVSYYNTPIQELAVPTSALPDLQPLGQLIPGFYDETDRTHELHNCLDNYAVKNHKHTRNQTKVELTPEVSKIITQTLYPVKKSTVDHDPLLCTLCNKSFSSFSAYKKHSRMHSAERVFPCPLCALQFSERANLKRHIRHMHQGERDFECPVQYCKTKFSRKSHLVHHLSGQKHTIDEVKANCTDELWKCVQTEMTKRKRK